jgi:hypothetical protein
VQISRCYDSAVVGIKMIGAVVASLAGAVFLSWHWYRSFRRGIYSDGLRTVSRAKAPLRFWVWMTLSGAITVACIAAAVYYSILIPAAFSEKCRAVSNPSDCLPLSFGD